MNLTSLVVRENQYKYLIKVDGGDYIYADTEEQAIMISREIAAERIKEIREKYSAIPIHVFSQDIDDGNSIKIFVQKRGVLYNGNVKEMMNISIVPIARCVMKNGEN